MEMLFFAADYLAEKIGEKVIGQQSAVKKIARALCENLEHYADDKPLKKNNILLMGPTGSGKTQIARSLSQVLNVPFVKVVMSDFTLTGYRGRDPQAIVVEDLKGAIRSEHRKNLRQMRIKYLARKRVLEALKRSSIPPIAFMAAVEFCGTSLLFGREAEEWLLEKFGKKRWIKRLLSEVKRAVKEAESLTKVIEKSKRRPPFDERPFGVVFIDEFDKILINERDGDRDSFFRPLQEFILPMVEGALITMEEGKIDTSHITFILAGSFAQRSPDEIVPELLGRLNVRAEVRKLTYEDYLKIAKIEGIEVPEVFKGKLVKIKPGALVEIAKACEELNSTEYLGARRLKQVVDRVNRAIAAELQNFGSLPLEVDEKFVRWALSYQPPEEEDGLPCPIGVPSSMRGLGQALKRALKTEKLQKSLIKEVLERCRIWLKDRNGKIDGTASSFSYFIETMLIKDCNGKSIIEHLVEEEAVKSICQECLEIIREKLGKEVAERIKEKVTVIPNINFPDLEF